MPKYSITHEDGLDPEYKRQRKAKEIREASDMRVTIDRISSSGNPIAAERYEGIHVHVPGAVEGETVFVKFRAKKSGYYIGEIVNPTVSQRERKATWKKRREERRMEKRRRKRAKSKKKRKKIRDKRKDSWKGQNKNHLIRHKP